MRTNWGGTAGGLPLWGRWSPGAMPSWTETTDGVAGYLSPIAYFLCGMGCKVEYILEYIYTPYVGVYDRYILPPTWWLVSPVSMDMYVCTREESITYMAFI